MLPGVSLTHQISHYDNIKGRNTQQKFRHNSTILAQPNPSGNQTENVSFHREVAHAFASADGITEVAKTEEDRQEFSFEE